MTNDQTFRMAFGLLILGLIVIRSYYALKSWGLAQSKMTNQWEGKGIALMRTFAALGWLALILLFSFQPDMLTWSSLPLPAWMRWAGAGFNVLTLGLLAWVHHTLGPNWSSNIEIRQGQTLVTNGPYRWMRHPMYSVLILWALSIFLLTASWLFGLIFVFFFVWFTWRTSVEETMLLSHFGEPYRTYMQHTGRFLPHFGK